MTDDRSVTGAAETESEELLEEIDNPIERLKLLAGNDEEIAKYLDAIEVTSPREREMLQEISRARPLARSDLFAEAHRNAVLALPAFLLAGAALPLLAAFGRITGLLERTLWATPAGGRRPHAVGRGQREADADLVRRASRWRRRSTMGRACPTVDRTLAAIEGMLRSRLPDEADSPQPTEEEHPRPVRSRCRSGAMAETVASAESGGPKRRKAFRADLAA